MKKLMRVGLALLFCMAFAVPAMAQDPIINKEINIEENFFDDASTTMRGEFDKLKIITIDTYKHINVFFNTEIEAKSDGEAETWGSQLNTENFFDDKGGTRHVITTTEETVTRDIKEGIDLDAGDRFPDQVTETTTKSHDG